MPHVQTYQPALSDPSTLPPVLSVCGDCGVPREQAGKRIYKQGKGFQCESCRIKEDEQIKWKALDSFKQKGLSSCDFIRQPDIRCPHCDNRFKADGRVLPEYECECCNQRFNVTVEQTTTYTTTKQP